MREVNFSVPTANRAAVGITTALYDRRALDCTSTLPLINSLNHLAYLTTSSARIREILTIDGGVERLVSILKNGRTKEMMDTWKWNLAFQCVVTIGVRGSDGRGSDNRGSENIRTRVVEADVVPVIATILDNYMKVMEKLKAQAEEADGKRSSSRFGPGKILRSQARERSEPQAAGQRAERRREPPAPIEIPPPLRLPVVSFNGTTAQPEENNTTNPPPSAPSSGQPIPSSAHDRIDPSSLRPTRQHDEPNTPGHSRENSTNVRYLDPLWSGTRDAHLMPPMTATSQPNTPLTPYVSASLATAESRQMNSSPVARPPLPHRNSAASGDSDDGQMEGLQRILSEDEPMVGIRSEMDLDDAADRAAIEGEEGLPVPDVTGDAEAETFNITHRSFDGSLIDPATTPTNTGMRLSPGQAVFAQSPAPEAPQPNFFSRYTRDQVTGPNILNCVPRDEDVIMSLQLLAYVSKYCDLRHYFQATHLVPKLKLGSELNKLDGDVTPTTSCVDAVDNDEEYCQPDDYNIFPLVEKFTVRHHTNEMKYWAGVVMRNLCRKDKSRGDIRQCAYYKCGKWEEYARQFAKCRRCRQTKYCSKECQKSAWVLHR
ncbi:MAG: hypothetical protein M1828_003762 [Chrysothrix sp. TS-e1954]|nr:MAG: hypothetical protein M1828_003762 [Chrysothrix sp. TS-e1954]